MKKSGGHCTRRNTAFTAMHGHSAFLYFFLEILEKMCSIFSVAILNWQYEAKEMPVSISVRVWKG